MTLSVLDTQKNKVANIVDVVDGLDGDVYQRHGHITAKLRLNWQCQYGGECQGN